MYPRSRRVFVRRPRIRENVNDAIRAREVRAVFPDGEVAIMPTPLAVRKAKELGLDLIVVAPTANPPVAKAMDYGQWQYEQKKRKNEAKKKQHVIQVKELKFRPNTKGHDYDFKKKHALRFLKEGNRVKAVVQFRGREITHMNLGRSLLMKLAQELAEFATVEGNPRLEGRFFHIILSPTKAAMTAGLKEREEKQAHQTDVEDKAGATANGSPAEGDEEFEDSEDFEEDEDLDDLEDVDDEDGEDEEGDDEAEEEEEA